jgi:hypothetical protein
MRVWLKYSADYDGWIHFLHCRFYNTVDAALNEIQHFSGNPLNRDNVVRAGYWPAAPDTWKLVELSFKLLNPASRFEWYVAFPGRGSRGSAWFTGMSVTRLGGPGSC